MTKATNASVEMFKPEDVTVENNVPATMRDGVTLRADIYRPNTDDDLPVLLCRTPYQKLSERHVKDAANMAQRGYLVVVQDVRGRHASDGEFNWMFDDKYREAEDGYDTVEWAAALPGSTGKVGAIGLSYDAWNQWEMARLRPPHLVAIAPVGIGPRLLDLNYGIFETGRRLQWCYAMGADYFKRAGITVGPLTMDEAKKVWHETERGKWLWFLPFDDLPANDLFHGLAEQFRHYLRHQNVEYWRFPAAHSQVNVPAMSITGWYDRLIGAIDHFVGMRQNGMTEHARSNQKLIIGPWGHTTDLTRQVGDLDFGPDAALNYYDLLAHWYDYWLKGINTGVMDEPPIRRFVMGQNVWRTGHEWPLPNTVPTDYYFHSGGSANTPQGDGRLSPTPPGDEPADSYVYDPKDPVMSVCTVDVQDGPYDQRPLDRRRDVLVFATEPLAEEIEVTGEVVVKLFAASTAPDTDFTAKLVDVHPDGFAANVCHGIVRAQYRESYQNPSLITPGQIYEYTILLRATGNLFQKGHQIRVDISSSNFPFFDRNHNTGRPFYEDAELVPATQTIYHSAQHPSRVILPVVPRS